jgi:hypothetical protein
MVWIAPQDARIRGFVFETDPCVGWYAYKLAASSPLLLRGAGDTAVIDSNVVAVNANIASTGSIILGGGVFSNNTANITVSAPATVNGDVTIAFGAASIPPGSNIDWFFAGANKFLPAGGYRVCGTAEPCVQPTLQIPDVRGLERGCGGLQPFPQYEVHGC